MTGFITVKEAAQRWDITPRRIQILCNEERIVGAVKQAGVWLIPCNTQKPAKQKKLSANVKRQQPLNVLSLFSGCGGMDLGFEGDFDVISSSVNKKIHPDWATPVKGNPNLVHLKKQDFIVFLRMTF